MVEKKRLLTLAKYLRRLKPSQLDMDSWVTQNGSATGTSTRSAWSTYANITKLTEGSCGYAACAVGHAGSIRSFREAGFKMVATDRGTIWPSYVTKDSKVLYNWEAVEAFFGLTYLEAERLFGAYSYHSRQPGPKLVAERIETFVKEQA